eukprot:TRINITY_DN17687_c0_g1_i1.p1 TRINITY_DN17687_c0_g1~~TRINITY_DN17687_c0_g1_i1.p1  ORF type:complete len:538 (+),score=150.60 TRINITY_DN17687_c0_g1_i1:265-1878(+)
MAEMTLGGDNQQLASAPSLTPTTNTCTNAISSSSSSKRDAPDSGFDLPVIPGLTGKRPKRATENGEADDDDLEDDAVVSLLDLPFGLLHECPQYVDLICMVVTESERRAAFNHILVTSKSALKGDPLYFGKVDVKGTSKTVLLCQPLKAGSGGVGRAQELLTAVLQRFGTRLVVAVGVAFGKDAGVQLLKDVLVSTSILPYEHTRVGESEEKSDSGEPADDIVDRNEVYQVNTEVVKACKGVSREWEDSEEFSLHLGAVLCGEKLVDNERFKAKILALKSNDVTIVGGEMEGSGMFTACPAHLPCIVVKGVCDHGVGKSHLHKGDAKKQIQFKAANNAWTFLLRLLQVLQLKVTEAVSDSQVRHRAMATHEMAVPVAALGYEMLRNYAEQARAAAEEIVRLRDDPAMKAAIDKVAMLKSVAESTARVAAESPAVKAANAAQTALFEAERAIDDMYVEQGRPEKMLSDIACKWPFSSTVVAAQIDGETIRFERSSTLGKCKWSASLIRRYMDGRTFVELEDAARSESTYRVAATKKSE